MDKLSIWTQLLRRFGMNSNNKVHTLEFKTGVTTCAYEYGKFCPFLTTTNFGTKYRCFLFNQSIYDDDTGCLARCQDCLDKFK